MRAVLIVSGKRRRRVNGRDDSARRWRLVVGQRAAQERGVFQVHLCVCLVRVQTVFSLSLSLLSVKFVRKDFEIASN